MKYCRILLAIVLILTLCFTVAACNKDDNPPIEQTEREKVLSAAAAAETELDMLYVSDTHYMASSEVGLYTASEDFVEREKSCQKMNHIGEAVFKQFCDDVIASGKKLLLIGGDINETGSKAGHEKLVLELDRVRAAGVNVYVVPGNHDTLREACYVYGETTTEIPSVTRDEFADIYANYGYKDHVAGTPLNYTAALSDKYTLVAFDNGSYEKCPDENLQWAVDQVKAIVAAGKTPILMMHKPLVEIFVGLDDLAGIKVSGSFVNGTKFKTIDSFAEALYSAGLNILLTGHMHSGDILVKDYVDTDDNPGILQIMNDTLTSYNSGYFNVKFKKDYVETTALAVSAPKESYLPAYLSAAEKNAILTDWKGYNFDFGATDLVLKVESLKELILLYVPTYVCGKAYDDMTEAQQIKLNAFIDGLFTYLSAPLYTKDKKAGETSLEELLAKYGFTGTLPASDYKSVMDVVTGMVQTCYLAGSEDIAVTDLRWTLTKYGIYGLIATIAEKDLFGLMKDCGVNVEDLDHAPMLRKLVTEDILDLELCHTIEDLLQLPVLTNLTGIVKSILGSMKREGVWYTIGNVALELLDAMIGEEVDVYALFLTDDEAAEAARLENPDDNDVYLSGEIDAKVLFDELIFDFVGNGVFYDELSGTIDVIYVRATGVAYDK